MFLVIYVDDFKFAGPKNNLKLGWELLRKGLSIDPECEPGVYLGCAQERKDVTMKDGRRVTTMTYNMEDFLGSCVTRYLELAGPGTRLKAVNTSFIPEETKDSHAGKPSSATGVTILCKHCRTAQAVKEVSCSWCKKAFTPERVPDEPTSRNKKKKVSA